ncbi:MAG: substrate-binding domain-containing protein, partial [Anaerolineales bacterium]
GFSHVCGSHLFDEASGEYNLPTLRHLFPDRPLSVVTLTHRIQGLILPAGNPKGIRGLEDLARADICLVNRNRGSGTRIWLERALHQAAIDPHQIRGFDQEVNTHEEAALWVYVGRADLALGLQSAASRYQLEFIPLFEERYDLILAEEGKDKMKPLFDLLSDRAFRQKVSKLPGYSLRQSGEQINLGGP